VGYTVIWYCYSAIYKSVCATFVVRYIYIYIQKKQLTQTHTQENEIGTKYWCVCVCDIYQKNIVVFQNMCLSCNEKKQLL